MTVKNQADIETPTTLTGYIVDGNMSVPIDQGNRHYREVQVWIADGNTPDPAYTQEELDAYALSQVENALVSAINDIKVTYNVDGIDYIFSGHFEAQNRITVAIAKTKGNPNKTQIWFTADSQKVRLKESDLEAILALIDAHMEAIIDV